MLLEHTLNGGGAGGEGIGHQVPWEPERRRFTRASHSRRDAVGWAPQGRSGAERDIPSDVETSPR